MSESRCAGCGLAMPAREGLTAHGYYNASPECWSVYTEVLGREYSDAVLFGQVHQLTVDTYAAQHAGGEHPDKSVDIHLAGLHLLLDESVPPAQLSARRQKIAEGVDAWPHLEPPHVEWKLTVFDVALAGSSEEHVRVVREWARHVWDVWRSNCMPVISTLL